MAQVILARRIDTALADVWASWNDFGNIFKFNPNLADSRLITDTSKPTRVGTRRQCDLSDGKNWVREEIIDYRPMQRMTIAVYESTVPVKSMLVKLEFEEISALRTRVRLTADFEPKFGVLGRLMIPLMKKEFEKLLGAMLDGNAEYLQHQSPMSAAA
jgi:hypothetical protein